MTKSLVSLFSGVLLFFAVFGQKFNGDVFTAKNFSIKHWTTSNGLPQNTINGIVQDSLGYMWMATNEGLVRFDGNNFDYFHSGNTEDVKGMRFQSLTKAADGTLYATSLEGYLISISDNEFKSYPFPNGQPIHEAFTGRNGRINICIGKIIYEFHSGEFHALIKDIPGIVNNTFLYNPANDSYYFGNQSGLFVYDNAHFELIQDQLAFVGSGINQEGEMFFVSNTGLHQLVNNELQLLSENVGTKVIKGILFDADGKLWHGNEHGLWNYNESNAINALQKFGIQPQYVTSFCIDQDNNYWIGTLTNGIFLIHQNPFVQLNNFFGIETKSAGPVYLDHQNNIHLGFNCGSVYQLNSDDHQLIKHAAASYKSNTGSSESCFWSIGEDKFENLYFGTFGQGLMVKPSQSAGYTLSQKLQDRARVVYALAEINQEFWIGTQTGFYIYYPEEEHLVDGNAFYGLEPAEYHYFFKDNTGRIWLASDKGLLAINTTGNKTRYGKKDGLGALNVRYIYQDKTDNIWVGTYGGGLSLYDPEKGAFITYNKANGLGSNVVSSIFEIKDHLYLTSNIGLHAIKKDQLLNNKGLKEKFLEPIHFKNIQREESLEFNGGFQPSLLQIDASKIILPTTSGFVLFNADVSTINENVLIRGHKVSINDSVFAYEPNSTLYLDREAGKIEINISASIFVERENYQFKYRLTKQKNTKWLTASINEDLIFSNLPSGSYELEVQLTYGGSAIGEIIEIPIMVEGPLSSEPWFWFAIFILLILAFLVVLRIRSNVNTSQKARLLKIIAKQTKHIQGSKANLEAVLESSSDLVFSFDLDFHLITANKKFHHVFENTYHKKVNIGDPFIKYVKPHEAQVLRSKIPEILKGEKIKEITKFPGDFYFEFTMNPIIQNLQVVGVSAYVRNVSEQVKKEEELSEARHKAENESKSRTQFLATMSHEIRTPMNGVVGMTSLLNQTELSEEQQDLVDVIDSSAKSLLVIINDILDFGKADSKQLRLHRNEFKLEKCIQESFSLLSSYAKEKGIELIYEIDNNLPSLLIGDADRLRQVLINLVNNALKFSEEGAVKVTVIRLDKTDKNIKLQFSVKDNGIGISEKLKKNLFKPYNQLKESTTKLYGGTGLGLAICKLVVELFKGEIWVDSEENAGSTFHFTGEFEYPHMKLGTREVSFENEQKEANKIKVIKKSAATLKILVAEDNLVNQKLTGLMLDKLGFTYQIVSNGALAVNLLEKTAFDLVLMDVQMPEMNGIEATKVIRKSSGINKDLVIIAMTANALSNDLDDCISAGMNDYLVKPVDLQNFSDKLAKWTQQ